MGAEFSFGIYWQDATPEDVAGVDANARDEYGMTPLHFAALFNINHAVVKALLDAGADVNAQGSSRDTPLHEAAKHNSSPAVTEALLAAGADVNLRNQHGDTMLHEATWGMISKGIAVIEVLLSAKGVDVNAQNNYGQTPLHKAVLSSRNSEIIIALLNHGANAKLKDNKEKTAFDIIQENENLKDTDAYRALREAQSS